MIRKRHLSLLTMLMFTAPLLSANGQSKTPPESAATKVAAAAADARLSLEYDGSTFSGAAWQSLVREGGEAEFFLIGEEHGIAENPKLIAQLFTELASVGYRRLLVEISPTMAGLVDEALRTDGLAGLRALFARPGGEPAFFGMKEEAEMLADIRAVVPDDEPAFWGTDYDVLSDQVLIAQLKQAEKPPAAEAALSKLAQASAESWSKHQQRGSADFIFSFVGDPDLVRAVAASWPKPDPGSELILNTLEKTLLINQHWVNGRHWESNRDRAALQRQNFLRYWQSERQQQSPAKVMAKFGASHMIRGLSQTAVFDLGTLLPEIAEAEGSRSVSLLVVPGIGSSVAVLNPATLGYEPQPAKDGYHTGLDPLLEVAFKDSFTLIDLRSLRSVVGMNRRSLHNELYRIVHGFDLLLVMSGSMPAQELQHPVH